MTAWSEERLVYDGEPWGWNSVDPTVPEPAGWNNQFSGWNSVIKIFTEEPKTIGTITEEVP